MKNISFILFFFVSLFLVEFGLGLDFDISGRCVVKHYSHSNEILKKNSIRDDYSSMELMLNPVFTVNENIKLTAELTALQDHVWGTHAQPEFQQENPLIPAINSANNIDWKSAYMTLRTGIGGFLIGRGIEKRWGTGLGDSTGGHGNNSKHKDGILWVVPVGNFISGIGWQHIEEADKGNVVADSDFDKSYVFSAYKEENWHIGLLLARYDHKNFVIMEELRKFQKGYVDFQNSLTEYKKASAMFGIAYKASEDMEQKGYYDLAGLSNKAKEDGYNSVTMWELEKTGDQIAEASGGVISMPDLNSLMFEADIAQAVATSYGAKIKDGPERSILGLWVFDPYIIGDFGSFKIEAEFLYGWGKVELPEPKFSFQSSKGVEFIDVEGFAGTLGIWKEFDSFVLGSGVTYVQGDHDSYYDGKFSGIGYLESSIDFERGFLLTSDISCVSANFGGKTSDGLNLGNLAGGPISITGPYGYKMFWIESNYRFGDNFNVGVLCVVSHADDLPDDWSSNHGIECDFIVNWNIMKNLDFEATIAHLDAGNFWKAGEKNREIYDTTAIHAKLSLVF